MNLLHIAAAALLLAAAPAAIRAGEPVQPPRKITFATELQMNPFSRDATFSLDALMVRCYLTPRHVVAAEVGFRIKSHKDVANTDFKYRWTSNRNGTAGFSLGYQYVYVSHRRLNLYAGAKIGYQRAFASSTESLDEDRSVVYRNYDDIDNVGAADIVSGALTTGIDFYVYRGLYVGAEFGIYLTDRIPLRQTRLTKTEGGTAETHRRLGGHTLNVSTAASPLLRLGWRF